jgi:hypothetical protein
MKCFNQRYLITFIYCYLINSVISRLYFKSQVYNESVNLIFPWLLGIIQIHFLFRDATFIWLNSRSITLYMQTFCFTILFSSGVHDGGRDRMVVGFTTTYAISAYHHWCCKFESRSGEVYSIQCYVIKFVSDLRQVVGFLQVLRFPPPNVSHNIYLLLLN